MVRCSRFALLLSFSICSFAADQPSPPPIQDNSFLIEEAYNQEPGVIQEISTLARFWNSKDWICTFTQEWPAPADWRHQLSYTVAWQHAGAFPQSGSGLGDLLLNYRFQLLGSGETRVAFSPRMSLIFSTGDGSKGRSLGGTGVQTNLPLSVVIFPKLVTHWNLGATIVPHATNPVGVHASTYGYNLGQSFIWLAKPGFNALLETSYSRFQAVAAPGQTQWLPCFYVSPGVRWAYNLRNGLQIVPGIALPMGVGPSHGEKGVFLYLSFEHPYRSIARK